MPVGMTDSPQASIGKLLRDYVFQVPPYQRDYRWPVDKVTQLFDDIDAAIQRGDDRYFLGLMVFMRVPDSSNGLIVLDGQQRLATVFVFLAMCRNWMRQYSELQRDAVKIDNDFMGERLFGEQDIVRPRLVLNSANNATFDAYVVNARPVADLEAELARTKKQSRSRRLLEAAVYCHSRIAGLSEQTDYLTCHKHLARVVNFLNLNAPVVNMTAPDEGTAFTIFETLNDRGLDLSPLDLVKNHLFRCLGTDDPKQRDLEQRWGQMMATLEDSSPDQFLKAFWTSRFGRVQANNLFREFTERYKSSSASVDVSIDMLSASERYAAMANSDDPVWSQYPETVRELVRSLHTLGAQQTHPVVMAALERFDAKELERLLRLLEVLIVRYQFIGGGRTGALEIECAKVAHGIYERRIPDAATAFKEFRSVYTTDEKFKAALRDMRKASAAKTIYLLKGLEREAQRVAASGPVAGIQLDADIAVEHIYPQSPGAEWSHISEDDDDDLSSLLGNLCLLRKNANRSLGRAVFAKKRQTYAESGILLTRQVAEGYEKWDKKAIQRRQNYLADLGVQAWRFQWGGLLGTAPLWSREGVGLVAATLESALSATPHRLGVLLP